MLYVCWMLPLATCCHTRYHLHTFEIWLLSNNKHLTNVWQSNIIPFRISTTLKHCSALTSVKDGTHMCYVHRRIRYLCTYAVHMSPALNGSSALQRFKHGNAVERLNGLMFDFYTWPTTNSTEDGTFDQSLPIIYISTDYSVWVPYMVVCVCVCVCCCYHGNKCTYTHRDWY